MLRRHRLSFEPLEERLTPASIYWVNLAGGAWETPANWSTGTVPTSADDAFLIAPGAAGTVTVASARTVKSLTVDTTPLALAVNSGGTLTVTTTNNVPTTIQAGGALTVSGTQQANVTINGGTHTTANFEGFDLIADGATAKFSGTVNKNATVDGANVQVNAGATLTLVSGTVLNLPGQTLLKVSGSLLGSGTVAANTATVNVRGSIGGSVVTNLTNATLAVNSGDAGTITGGGTWTGVTFEVENALPALPAGKVTLAGQTLSGTQTGVLKAGSAGVPAAHAVQLNGVAGVAGGTTYNFAPGLLTWTAGHFNHPITNAGEFTLNVAGTMTPTSTTTNNGTFIHLAGNVQESGNPVFTNAVGGVYDIRGDVVVNWQTFDNKGGILRSAGSGTATILPGNAGNFNSTGSITVQTGTLTTPGSGTTTGASYSVAAGAILDLGPQAYAGIITATGAGLVRFANGFSAIGGLTEFNVPTPGLLQWTGGGGGGTWKNSGHFTINSTTNVIAVGAATNTGTIVHAAGDVNEGGNPSLLNEPGAVYDIRGDVLVDWQIFVNNGSIIRTAGTGTATIAPGNAGYFNNTGSITVQTGTLATPSLGTTTGATYAVAAGAILDLGPQAYAGTITGSGAGLIRFANGFSGSGGATEFSMPTPGLLQWTGGGTGGTWKNSGHLTINTASNVIAYGAATNTGTIVHAAGNVNEGGNPSLLNEAGAIYEIRGDCYVDFQIFVNKGSIVRTAGTGLSTIASGNAGYVDNYGSIAVQSGTLATSGVGTFTGATLSVAAGAVLDLGRSVYTGTIAGSGAGLIRFANGFRGSDAVFSVPTPDLLQWTAGLASGSWTNAGSLTINSATNVSTSGVATNTGTIIQAAGNVNESVNPSLTNAAGGVYEIRGDFYVDWQTFVNKGTVVRSAGTGTASIAIGNSGSFSNNGGSFNILTGTLDPFGPVVMSATSTLSGAGTLLAPVTAPAGFIRPGGLGTARLTVTGNYSQTAAAQLRIELNGLTPVTQHDVLAVNGTVTLGGPLDLVSGYGAALGDTFVILENDGTDAVVGTFAGLPQGGKLYSKGVEYTIDYASGTGNDVRLTVTSLESVIVNTGALQRSRLTSIELHTAVGVNAATLAAGGVTLTRTLGSSAVTLTSGAVSGGRINLDITSSIVNDLVFTFDNVNGALFSSSVEAGSLADGYWQLSIPSIGYTSPLNSTYFRRLFGDADASGTVNTADLTAFGNDFNAALNRFDFNNDGVVNNTDLTAFGNRFNVTL